MIGLFKFKKCFITRLYTVSHNGMVIGKHSGQWKNLLDFQLRIIENNAHDE